MAKVTGIGGVFFKSTGDNVALRNWYEKNLGMVINEWGCTILEWEEDKHDDNGCTVWHAHEKDSQWFAPSKSSFMINYRIDNMDEMIKQLKANGVEIQQGPEEHDQGKFLWIMDPDGNKVELWEPKPQGQNAKEKKAEVAAK
jgi:predicted enzyme related to lactoylglutathione lyase